jgi:hypothetical protein
VACGMHPLSTGVGFGKVATLVTPSSNLKVPLPKFVAVRKDDEDMFSFWLGWSWKPKVLWVAIPAQGMKLALRAFAMEVS